MPIYEYSCALCGHGFELLVRSDADLPGRCPECGVRKPVKSLSSFAVSRGGSSVCSSCPAAGGDEGSCGCRAGGCHHH